MSIAQIDYRTQVKNGPVIDADSCMFTRRPGGSLAVGANTVTLRPVPFGVNGSDAAHVVYISGGVGTAEAVLITGGNAVSGSVSGTITFTCAHSHTGSWTITSATAGGQEAHNGAIAGSLIQFPAGANLFYGLMTATKSEVTIQGCGGGSVLYQSTLSSGIITNTINGFGSQVRDLTFTYNGAAQSNVAALTFQGTPAGDIFWPRARSLKFNGVATGIRFVDAQYFSAMECFNQSFSEYAVSSSKVYGSTDGGDSRIQDCTFGGGIAAIYLNQTPVVFMTANKYNAGQYGLHAVDSGGMVVANSSFENHTAAAMLFEATVAGGGSGILVENNLIDQNFDVAWDGIEIAPYAVGAIKDVQIKNNYMSGAQYVKSHVQTGVRFGGASPVDNVSISGNFRWMDTAVNVSASSSNVTVSDYNLGTGSEALPTPFVINNTETTLRPNAPVTFAQLTALGSVRDGSQAYCSDGQVTSGADNTVKAGGGGIVAFRANGVWRGFGPQN